MRRQMSAVPVELRVWVASSRCREIRMSAPKKMHDNYKTLPRCGAHARSTGETCRVPALSNGRCRFHGGRTPKGDQYHVRVLANPGRSIAKLDKKLAEFKRRDEQREKRAAAKSESERRAHEEWQRSQRPGPTGRRRRDNAMRAQARDAKRTIDALFEQDVAEGASEIETLIKALERRVAERERWDVFS